MKSASAAMGIVLMLLQLVLFVVPPARAGEDTVKIGILHSLSGTMAISESVLKDTVLMLIADQNKKGGLLGRKLEPVVVDPRLIGALLPKRLAICSSRKRSQWYSVAGPRSPERRFSPSSSNATAYFTTPSNPKAKKAHATFSTWAPRRASSPFRPSGT